MCSSQRFIVRIDCFQTAWSLQALRAQTTLLQSAQLISIPLWPVCRPLAQCVMEHSNVLHGCHDKRLSLLQYLSILHHDYNSAILYITQANRSSTGRLGRSEGMYG